MTVLPTAPAVAFRLKAGPMVYMAEAEVMPSDAVTVWGPSVASGTVYAQERTLPLASAMQDVETVLPSKLTVTRAYASKTLPLIAALRRAAPVLGIRLRAGVTV